MTLSSIPLAGQYIFRIYQIRKLNFPPIRPQKLEAINDEECNHRPERRLLSFRHPYSTRRKPCSLEGATTLRSLCHNPSQLWKEERKARLEKRKNNETSRRELHRISTKTIIPIFAIVYSIIATPMETANNFSSPLLFRRTESHLSVLPALRRRAGYVIRIWLFWANAPRYLLFHENALRVVRVR